MNRIMDVNRSRQPGGSSVCSSAEEIVNLLMHVVEKKERCLDFDLQHWCTKYQHLRHVVNFPEVSMLIACAAQIYGRKADHLGDMILNMHYGQQAREETKSATENGNDVEAETPSTSTARKRAGRINPLSSDCFDDIEFTCSDKKLLKLDQLIEPPQIIEVDRRTNVQRMQDLCVELRGNPNRQRRQEILNRLRDEANIPPMLSSHGVARRNQILDLESGEMIGTRYDYQVHQNFIDPRTGSLIAEHDLKRYFQRCDVMDFLFEQQESERERCTRLGMPAPTDILSVRGRELKIFMPPDYLFDRYRINVNDTSDFDNALNQARVSKYKSDPILDLMDPAEAERCRKESEKNGNDSTVSSSQWQDSGCPDDTVMDEDVSFKAVLCSSRLNETNGVVEESQKSTENPSQLGTAISNESELLESESQLNHTKPESDSSAGNASRLSVDEGIGVDCESPPRSVSVTQEKNGKLLFTTGTIIPRQNVQRPVQLRINLFGIPDRLVQRNVVFALPQEYRRLKGDLTKRHSDQTSDCSRINLYSLHPTAPCNPLWTERPTTPESEDFLGFEDSHDEGGITSEFYFAGFTDEEAADTRKDIENLLVPSSETTRLASPKKTTNGLQTSDPTTSSPAVTPSRTLSCDSGISDSAERGKELSISSMNSGEKTSTNEHGDKFPGELSELQESAIADGLDGEPLKEHTEAANARIQQSISEIQERLEKVNQWHRKLKPVLIESEKRNHFDIHAYGTEIIDRFDQLTPGGVIGVSDDLQCSKITFAHVLEGKPPHSTSRYFLSMLMLANTNNVAILNKNRDPLRLSTNDEIELRLISRKRHHQEMEALSQLLPSGSEPENVRRIRQNRKRKMTLGDHDMPQRTHWQEEGGSPGSCIRPDPSERLGLSSSPIHETNFHDGAQQLYPQQHSDVSSPKRLTYHRGMRNYVNGLAEENLRGETSAKTNQKQHELSSTIKVLNGQCNSVRQSTSSDLPCTSYRDTRTFYLPNVPAEVDEDILTVNLVTNHATLTQDPDETCTQSVFSFAESGYESIFSG